MARLLSSICRTSAVALLVATSAIAHFTLTHPGTIGFADRTESSGPCGGVSPNFATATVFDFHVGGQPVGMKTGHALTTWLFRATLDQTAQSGWTQLFPLVQQASIGAFCEPQIPAPASWVGRTGLLGVVASGDDGLLYQCSAVRFVAGPGTLDGIDCRNGSNEAAFTSNSELAALANMDGWTQAPAPGTNTTGGTNGATTTNPSGSTTPTPTGNAAAGIFHGGSASLNGLVAVVALGAAGAAFML